MNRINKAKTFFWAVLGIAAAVGITRFIFGLGVTTNLSDNTPWGFWIGFDVMGGVALAAGGFVIAAVNYIFGKKRMHPISRAAILTAFLGYIAVAVGLLFDLGLPWNIWHMVIFWNPHSPLFEVGWCVMLYLTVLFLEFAPVILERWPKIKILASLYKFLNKIKIPLVILGIMLSTLHQSSLGSLFLAMPYKLHPLWYTPILPVIFFVSAICLGIMMVMVESMTTSYLYKKESEKDILRVLAKSAVVMILIYVVLRFTDIFVRGAEELLFNSGWASLLFWTEMLFSVIIPLVIFSGKALRRNINLMYFGALSGVFGIVFNRLNVGGITHVNNFSELYIPSLSELAISAGVVSAAVLVFFYFIENYKVWEKAPEDPDKDPAHKPMFSTNLTYFGPTKTTNRTRFSFMFMVAFGITFALISGKTIYGEGAERIRVSQARGGDTLLIDGNRDGYYVAFDHKHHQKIEKDCGFCHHMNYPNDKATGCYECHDYMYTSGDAFRHDWHTSPKGADLGCFQCHAKNVSKGKGFIKNITDKRQLCDDCHKTMFTNSNIIKYVSNFKTVSYTDAMHGLCITCHIERSRKDINLRYTKPNLAQCPNCHRQENVSKQPENAPKWNFNKWVIVPAENAPDIKKNH